MPRGRTTLASTIKVSTLEELGLSPDDYEVASEEYKAESPVDLRVVRVARELEPTPRVGPSSPFDPGLRLGGTGGAGLFRGPSVPTMLLSREVYPRGNHTRLGQHDQRQGWVQSR
jgi:hypothetical protein